MTKQDFIDQYEIKDALPVDPSRRVIPADALYSALCDFLEERFRGAVYAKKEPATAQSVLICAEYLAFFFKTLITDVYGRVMLNIRAESDNNFLYLVIDADNELPLTESELRSLVRLARNAGMEIQPDKCSLRLSVEFSPAAVHRVYAITIADGRRIMLGKLNEIFYCGEPLSEDASTCLLTERQKRDTKKRRRNK